MSDKKLLIFDFFSGTGSATQAFKDAGHTVIRFEKDTRFNANVHGDILDLTVEGLLEKFGQPDFIWASPPCNAFSVASVWKHWEKVEKGQPEIPKTEMAVHNIKLVEHALYLIDGLAPRYGWLMENPVGKLRKLPVTQGLEHRWVTYCRYGHPSQKPTDLWGGIPGWVARPPCGRKVDCHIAAPRGAGSGTMQLGTARLRSMVPRELGEEIMGVIEGLANGE